VAFRFAVLDRSRALDPRVRDALSVVTASRAAVVCGVFLVAALARFYLQHRMMMGDVGVDVTHMRTMAMETHWGGAWLIQFGAGVVALVGSYWRRVVTQQGGRSRRSLVSSSR